MEFSVMTFNIHHGKGINQQLNLDEIANIIKNSQADIIGLNEVDKFFSKRSHFSDQIGWLANELKMNHAFTPAIYIKTKGEREDRQYGNALLTRYPIADKKDHFFNFRRGFVEGRSMLEAKVQIEHHLVRIYVTHLSINPFLNYRQINAIIGQINQTTEPILIMGDWNMSPYSRGWRRMTSLLQDTWITGGKGNGHTYPSHNPKRRLDYIFASDSLLVSEAHVIKEKPEISDHLAVKIKVKLHCS